jgi:hypothetical protein
MAKLEDRIHLLTARGVDTPVAYEIASKQTQTYKFMKKRKTAARRKTRHAKLLQARP